MPELQKVEIKSARWPSGLRRSKAAVRKGVGSNSTLVNYRFNTVTLTGLFTTDNLNAGSVR